MADKIALITGVTGQDGAYLAELLLAKGYIVHGVKRRSSSLNTQRVDHLYVDPHVSGARFFMHYGDMTDATNLIRLIQESQPTEIYNLAAQSHVQVSFETPEYTANSDALGTLRLLEAIRILKMEKKVRFYQASTSELYGNSPAPQNEKTPFEPRSPYAAAKLYAYWITVNYREAYGMHASNGILFNHESPIRGETFVTRKISRAVAAIELGRQEQLFIGNLNSKRDWGHARDYVEGMWMMMQQPQPGDYVLATVEEGWILPESHPVGFDQRASFQRHQFAGLRRLHRERFVPARGRSAELRRAIGVDFSGTAGKEPAQVFIFRRSAILDARRAKDVAHVLEVDNAGFVFDGELPLVELHDQQSRRQCGEDIRCRDLDGALRRGGARRFTAACLDDLQLHRSDHDCRRIGWQ